jgi:lipopolysaccharide export system protein LptA
VRLSRPLLIAGASAVLAASAAFALSPAIGQEPASALRGHNSNAPIDIAADRIEVQDRADRAIISGNVIIRQAELNLAAPRVTLVYENAQGLKIQRVEASGGVVLRSPSETARSQYAIYDTEAGLITLIGGVTLTRGGSEVNGGRLILDLDTGRAVMDGGNAAPAAGTPGITTSRSGRVTGTFTVPQRPANPTNQPGR